MQKIKTGDEVVVLTGRDRGRRGNVIKIGTDHAVVEGVNIVKKHIRANPQRGTNGEIAERESKIHLSNIALYNSKTQKAAKVGIKTLEDGRKVRYFKDNKEIIDV